MKIIDLSHKIEHGMATYAGGSTVHFAWSSFFDTRDRAATRLEMSAHTGTHVDAPLHFIPGGMAMDRVPLESIVGYARILDMRDAPTPGGVIDHTYFMDAAAHLNPGDLIIVRTGIWKRFRQEIFTTGMPVLDERSMSHLVELPIRAYATDCISVDRMDSPRQSNHHLLLGNNIPIVEGLTNLDQISTSPVLLIVLPLKLVDREAAPARAIAIENLEER